MNLKKIHYDKIMHNAHIAAVRYRRRVWWADVDEMRQEAVKEQLAAARTIDLSGRTNPDDYFGAAMYRIAAISIKTMLCKASAPVSTRHRVNNLKGLTHATITMAPMGATDSDYFERTRPELVTHETPEHETQASEIARLVRDRVVEVLGADGAEFAMIMLSGEFSPREVVEEHGGEAETVYGAMRRIRAMLSADSTLHEMWRQINE